jgi:hypothetical protein
MSCFDLESSSIQTAAPQRGTVKILRTGIFRNTTGHSLGYGAAERAAVESLRQAFDHEIDYVGGFQSKAKPLPPSREMMANEKQGGPDKHVMLFPYASCGERTGYLVEQDSLRMHYDVEVQPARPQAEIEIFIIGFV